MIDPVIVDNIDSMARSLERIADLLERWEKLTVAQRAAERLAAERYVEQHGNGPKKDEKDPRA